MRAPGVLSLAVAVAAADQCPAGFSGPPDWRGCCTAVYSQGCNEACAKVKCAADAGWKWQDLDFAHDPFTCCPPDAPAPDAGCAQCAAGGDNCFHPTWGAPCSFAKDADTCTASSAAAQWCASPLRAPAAAADRCCVAATCSGGCATCSTCFPPGEACADSEAGCAACAGTWCPAPPTPPAPAPPTPPAPTPPTPPNPTPPGPSPPVPTPPSSRRIPNMLGYLENWGPTIKWWDNNMPGNCVVGCYKPQPFLTAVAPFRSLNYIGMWLTEKPDNKQTACDGGCPPGPCTPGPCPVWDGEAIYLADKGGAAGKGAIAVSESVTATSVTPGMVAISEAVRMARMHPSGPKRLKVTLGGWSDYARMATPENGRKVGRLMAKVVQWTFADGVDIDLEHITPFARLGDEFGAFEAMAETLRTEFDNTIAPQWVASAQKRAAVLQAEFDKIGSWHKAAVAPYYNSQIKYLAEVAANGAPHLELSWATRFNAFVPGNDTYNYITKDSTRPNATFETDNEGARIWPKTAAYFDTVNIMGYDAAAYGPWGPDPELFKLDFEKILQNCVQLGKVPPAKLVMGFAPGEQDAGAQWEGLDADIAATKYIKQNGFAGAFIWASNTNPDVTPDATRLVPQVTKKLNSILQPQWPWGEVPKYTKCNPSTGWWPGL